MMAAASSIPPHSYLGYCCLDVRVDRGPPQLSLFSLTPNPTASGMYVQSSEALHVVTNVIHANGDRGITVAQSSQLTRVANNSISCNRQSGVRVETQCKVELRGNGVYDNRGHGVITKGDNTVVIENDIIGNRGSGLQLLPKSDTKVYQCKGIRSVGLGRGSPRSPKHQAQCRCLFSCLAQSFHWRGCSSGP